jgi:hypothetical protein
VGGYGERVQERKRRISIVVMSEGCWYYEEALAQTCPDLRLFALLAIFDTLYGMTNSTWHEIRW